MAHASFGDLLAMGRVPAADLLAVVLAHARSGQALPTERAVAAIDRADLSSTDVLDLMKATLKGASRPGIDHAAALSYGRVNAHLLTVAAGLIHAPVPATPTVADLAERDEVTAPELMDALRDQALSAKPIVSATVKDLIDRMELGPDDIRALAAIADRGYDRMSARRDRRGADEYGRVGVHLAMRGYGLEHGRPGMGR